MPCVYLEGVIGFRYLVKASGSNWENDSVVGLEAGRFIFPWNSALSPTPSLCAGSGLGALEAIVKSDPELFGVNGETGKPYTAAQIFSYMK